MVSIVIQETFVKSSTCSYIQPFFRSSKFFVNFYDWNVDNILFILSQGIFKFTQAVHVVRTSKLVILEDKQESEVVSG